MGSQVASLVVPYAPELRELGSDELQLRELAGLTGGGPLGDPAEVFLKGRRPFHIAQEIWPWIVGLAALLLILDIAVRRFGFAWLGVHWLPRRRVRAAE